jgi:hypothetical protein
MQHASRDDTRMQSQFAIRDAVTAAHFGADVFMSARRRLSARVAIFVAAFIAACPTIIASAAPGSPSASFASVETDALEDSAYNGYDFTRPETSASLRVELRKSSGAARSTEREIEILQYNSKLKLSYDWTLATQIQIPFDEKTTLVDQSEPENAAGLSDAIFQAALIRIVSNRWAYGFGARLVAPTATDSVGTDRWQIMPAAGVRYSFLELNADTYFVPAVRYAISFGGNPTARTIREPQIAPTLNIGLPDNWFVTLYPSNDIRINFGTPISGQTGRLFLPFDAAFGKKVTDNLTVSLEGSVPIVKDYPVYDFKTEIKVTWQF